MNSKIFNQVIQEIRTGNDDLAKRQLAQLNYQQLTPAGKELYEACLKIIKPIKSNPQRPEGMLSEYDQRAVIPGVSIVSCCMNRNENLKKALESWRKLDVDEIVIVDWSSDEPVADTIQGIDDPRIKIVRVEGEPKWVLTYAFNVGLRFASYSKIYKFDADIQVSNDFLSKNHFTGEEFIRGSWQDAIDSGKNDQIYVNGSFGANKVDLLEIGYYNEFITSYGWDDSDLYERLAVKRGLKTKFLSFDSILHMEQEQEQRIENQAVPKGYFLDRVSPTTFNNTNNKFIGRTHDYWEKQKLSEYRITKVDDNLWQCQRTSENHFIPESVIKQAGMYAAELYTWTHRPELYTNLKENKDYLTAFILREYRRHVDFIQTLRVLGYGNQFETILYATNTSVQDFIKTNGLQSEDRLEDGALLAVLVGESTQINKDIMHISMPNLLAVDKATLNVINQIRALNQQQPLIEQAETKRSELKKLYIDAQHGLGNRLRAIASAAAIAQKSNRELVIVWEADHHCECEFSDLYEGYAGKVVNQSLLNSNHDFEVFNYMEIEAGAEKDKFINVHSDKDLYLRSAYTFNSDLTDWESENAFLKQLRPTREIQQLIAQVDVENCLAAHVRMEAGQGLDHNTYDSVDNWTQEGHDELHFWREKSHYSAFIKRIDQLVSENPELKLFVATDMQETYDIFENYYGDRLRYLKRSVYDRSKEQIKYALADAILLSKCNRLLGSTWSSFSELAMRLSENYSDIEMSGRDF